jgi:hypothetical protein
MQTLHHPLGPPPAHLQGEEAHHRLVVADAVRHVTVVRLLSDLQRELQVLVLAPLGPEPPQDPVGPGWLALLAARAGGE